MSSCNDNRRPDHAAYSRLPHIWIVQCEPVVPPPTEHTADRPHRKQSKDTIEWT